MNGPPPHPTGEACLRPNGPWCFECPPAAEPWRSVVFLSPPALPEHDDQEDDA